MNNDFNYYPLTFPQKNIYKTETAYPGTSIGTIAATLRIEDDNMDFTLIERALNLVIEKNEVMRCRVKLMGREPRQYFAEYKYEKFDFYDLSGKDIKELYRYDKEQTMKPFELHERPLYYFSIIKLSDRECAIYSKVHHIINDAWAIVRVGNLVLEYYEMLSKGIEIPDEQSPPYTEYITDELAYLSGDRVNVDKAFWESKLQTYPNGAILKQRRSKLVKVNSKRKTYKLPDRLSTQLREYCRETKTSIFAVILSAFSIYIKRTMQTNDMVIGTPVLNRSSRRQKKTLGMFISTVPLFISFEEDDCFTDFNRKLTREWMAVLKHQRYPYENILKQAREHYKDIKNLFDVVVSYQNASFTENQSSAKHRSRWHFNESQLEALTIHINDREGEGTLIIDYDFLEDLFFEKEIDYLHDNFIRVLWHALDNPARPLSQLELISEEEKRRMLVDFNSKEVPVPQNMTIVDMLAAQAKKTPDRRALVQGDKSLTYGELQKRSDVLAAYLIKAGLAPEDVVCVMADKSLNMIASLIAVLKAGGAYLAVEKELPADRHKYLLGDSRAKILLCDGVRESLGFSGTVIDINNESLYEGDAAPCADITPESLAYIMYTSGTVGEPKGVMIEHKSVVNYVHAFLDEFKYTGEETVLQQSSYSFDAFVEEVYPTLCTGATLVISSKYGAKDMIRLAETIKENNVSVVSVSPLVLNELNKMGGFDSIKTYISGGDVLKYEYYSNLIKTADVYNTYGPTETTVCATYHKCDGTIKEGIPIGSPIANYKVFILDKNLSLLPVGAPGDLYVSGPGLARGYLNRPELTEESFIENPYLPGQKMYRTNDIARWYPMGEIDYLGRSDRQVKIRGIRIELGEIESEMLKIENIKTAVVVDSVTQDGKKKLCAFYETCAPVSTGEVRDYLRTKLPLYMVPSYYLEMRKIPLSSSGKVNVSALPDINSMILSEENEYVAPESEVEIKVAELIKTLLKVEKVGMTDNYFELGGDSLDLTTLAYDIIDEFGVEVPLEKLFMAQTVKDICDEISRTVPKDMNTLQQDGNVFLLHEGGEGKNLFFIHDGIGGVGAYFPLTNELKEFTVWGIRANMALTTEPQNISIEEIAREYTKQIINTSSEPYAIAGWCIGGTIAYEIARQLELLGKAVSTVFIMDSIEPKMWADEYRFTTAHEKNIVKQYLNFEGLSETLDKSDSVAEIWENVASDIEKSPRRREILSGFIKKLPDDVSGYLDEYAKSPVRDMLSFINLVRTYHIARVFYYPMDTISADLCFIQASCESVAGEGDGWEIFAENKYYYYCTHGSHYTMMDAENAKETAKIIRKRVTQSETLYANV